MGPSKSTVVVSDLESIHVDGQLQLGSFSSASGQRLIADRMPHLSDPKVMAAMRRAVSDVAQARSVLTALGDRPDHETVDAAKAKLAGIEASLSKKLEELVLSPLADDVDKLHLAEREQECRESAEEEKRECEAILQLEELHAAYEKLLKDAEERLLQIYRSAEAGVVEEEEVVDQVKDVLKNN